MARLTQKQVEDWIAKNGGADSVQYSVEQKQIRNPSADITEQTLNPYITIEVEVWRNGKTGAELTARRTEAGDFEQIENKGADPSKPAVTAGQKPQGSTTQVEGTPDPSKPGGFDNERPVMVTRGPDGRLISSEPLTPAEMTEWRNSRERSRNPGGKTDAEIKAEKDKTDADAARTAPKPEKDGSGNWGYWDTKQTPPRWVPIQGSTPAGEQPKPVEVNGQWGVWKPGANGTPVWTPVQAPQAATLPEGLPQFRPDFNHPDGGWGLIEYTNQLRELLTKRKPDGTPYLTEKQFQDLVSQAHASTTGTAGRLDTIRAQQAQLQANEISQRNTDANVSATRLGQANSATQTALDQSMKMAGVHTPESYKAGGGAILPAILALQAMNAQQYGGMNQPARVGTQGYPVLDQLGRATIPGVADLTRPVPPNAIGVGSVGAVPAPGGAPAPAAGVSPLLAPNQPVSAAQASAVAAAANPPPTAGEPGGPPLAPGPVAPTPGAGDPRSMGAPENPVSAGTTIITVRDRQSGGLRQMRLADFNAMPDRDQYEVIDPNGTGSVSPTPQPPSPMEPDGTATVFSPVPPGKPSWMRNNKTGEIRQMTYQQHLTQPDVGDWSVVDGPPEQPNRPDFGSPDMQVIAPPATTPGFQIPSPGQPWPNQEPVPSGRTLPAVNNMAYVANVLGQRPPHASEADWQAAVRQAAAEMGVA